MNYFKKIDEFQGIVYAKAVPQILRMEHLSKLISESESSINLHTIEAADDGEIRLAFMRAITMLEVIGGQGSKLCIISEDALRKIRSPWKYTLIRNIAVVEGHLPPNYIGLVYSHNNKLVSIKHLTI